MKRMNEARLFGSAAMLILLIAVAYMSTTREGGEGGEVCVLDPKPPPVVGAIADVPPRPLAIAGKVDFYNSLDDVRKRLEFDDEPTNHGVKRDLEEPSDGPDVKKGRFDDLLTEESPGGKIRLRPEWQARLDALRGSPALPGDKNLSDEWRTHFSLDDLRKSPDGARPIGGPKPVPEILHSESGTCRTRGDAMGQVLNAQLAGGKPRSQASLKRIKHNEAVKRGPEENETEENETGWGVKAFDDAILQPEYAEYLKYLERVNSKDRAENEARNQMHDVLRELSEGRIAEEIRKKAKDRAENEARNQMHDVLRELSDGRIGDDSWVTKRKRR